MAPALTRGVYAVVYERGPCGSDHLRTGVHLGFRLFRPKRRGMHGDGRSDREARDRVSRREFPVQIRHAKERLLVLPHSMHDTSPRSTSRHAARPSYGCSPLQRFRPCLAGHALQRASLARGMYPTGQKPKCTDAHLAMMWSRQHRPGSCPGTRTCEACRQHVPCYHPYEGKY